MGLWGLLNGALPRGGVPGGTTWGRMCGDAKRSDLMAAMNRGRGNEGMRVASWNPRWMVSPHTEQGAAKRKRIQKAIGTGTIVTVQRTHWSVSDMAIWSGLFAGAEVVATEARPGPMEGRKEE